MKAGIAVDDYKLSIYRAGLEKAGYAYTDAGALTVATTLLHVETDDLEALRAVLERCELECREAKS